MDDSIFDELVHSVKEAGSIKREEKRPSRTYHFDESDVKAIWEKNPDAVISALDEVHRPH